MRNSDIGEKLALQPELNITIFTSTQANSNSATIYRCHLPSKSRQDSFYSAQTLYISPDIYHTPCSTSAKICTSSTTNPSPSTSQTPMIISESTQLSMSLTASMVSHCILPSTCFVFVGEL